MHNLVVTLSPLLDLLIQAVAALLLAFGTWGVTRLADWLKLSADDRVRGYLIAAMERAIDYAQHHASARLSHGQEAGDGVFRDVTAEVVDIAAGYLEERVPDALKRLGVSGQGLEDMIRARLARG